MLEEEFEVLMEELSAKKADNSSESSSDRVKRYKKYLENHGYKVTSKTDVPVLDDKIFQPQWYPPSHYQRKNSIVINENFSIPYFAFQDKEYGYVMENISHTIGNAIVSKANKIPLIKGKNVRFGGYKDSVGFELEIELKENGYDPLFKFIDKEIRRYVSTYEEPRYGYDRYL